MKRRKSGFTLIELLVVIAIVAILAAILFPVFAKARATAQQASCASNMVEVARACLMYADVNNGKLPPFYYRVGPLEKDKVLWYTAIQPFIKSKRVLCCPAIKFNKQAEFDAYGNPNAVQAYSRIMGLGSSNPYVFRSTDSNANSNSANYDPNSFGYLISSTRSTSRTMMLCESYSVSVSNHQEQGMSAVYSKFSPDFNGGDFNSPQDADSVAHSRVANRHSGNTNVAFLDGHVKCLPREQIVPDTDGSKWPTTCNALATAAPQWRDAAELWNFRPKQQ